MVMVLSSGLWERCSGQSIWARRTDARELPRTDLDLADAQIVLEFLVAGSLHAVYLGGAYFTLSGVVYPAAASRRS
jgi:hypothetical protein